ncbi:MAG TPA: YgjV family protein [Stellaceae bacterium]|nr:YgjV family protein [Stellaceae bacterium]
MTFSVELAAVPFLANGAGVVGIVLGASWALLNRRSTILVCQTVGALCFALHFFLLGATIGAVTCLAGAVQSVAARLPLAGRARIALYGATLVLAGAVTLAAGRGVPSLLALFALGWATIGRVQDDTQRMRLAFLASTGAWAVHNFLVGSIVGNVSDALTSAGILAGLWTHRRRQRRLPLLAPRPARA